MKNICTDDGCYIKCCGTCKHHRHDSTYNEWYCGNEDADAYTSETGYADGGECPDWEVRE